jgi:hypothetical protein
MQTCTFGVLLSAALLALVQPQPRPLTATVSRAAITVGEDATVAFSGGQLDVSGGNSIEKISTGFTGSVDVQRLDRATFSLKGRAACACALVFTDGQSKTTVKIRVLKK